MDVVKMNKAKEKLNEYINKNIAKEKDKFACGSKNNYFEWQEVKAELENRIKQSHEEQEQIKLYREFVKEYGLEVEFRKWCNTR